MIKPSLLNQYLNMMSNPLEAFMESQLANLPARDLAILLNALLLAQNYLQRAALEIPLLITAIEIKNNGEEITLTLPDNEEEFERELTWDDIINNSSALRLFSEESIKIEDKIVFHLRNGKVVFYPVKIPDVDALKEFVMGFFQLLEDTSLGLLKFLSHVLAAASRDPSFNIIILQLLRELPEVMKQELSEMQVESINLGETAFSEQDIKTFIETLKSSAEPIQPVVMITVDEKQHLNTSIYQDFKTAFPKFQLFDSPKWIEYLDMSDEDLKRAINILGILQKEVFYLFLEEFNEFFLIVMEPKTQKIKEKILKLDIKFNQKEYDEVCINAGRIVEDVLKLIYLHKHCRNPPKGTTMNNLLVDQKVSRFIEKELKYRSLEDLERIKNLRNDVVHTTQKRPDMMEAFHAKEHAKMLLSAVEVYFHEVFDVQN